jgi:hypothetical protein
MKQSFLLLFGIGGLNLLLPQKTGKKIKINLRTELI